MGQAQAHQYEKAGNPPQNTLNVHEFLLYLLDAERLKRIRPWVHPEVILAIRWESGHDAGHRLR
jgi:hypothetical protein